MIIVLLIKKSAKFSLLVVIRVGKTGPLMLLMSLETSWVELAGPQNK